MTTKAVVMPLLLIDMVKSGLATSLAKFSQAQVHMTQSINLATGTWHDSTPAIVGLRSLVLIPLVSPTLKICSAIL